jgi:hypothetical protein
MGSSFHWTDSILALKEFYRILKPGGFFTTLWNPRDIEANLLHKTFEENIHKEIPNIKRASSGGRPYTDELPQILLQGGYFKSLIFVEASYEMEISRDRYLGAWRSVNDIQAQAGVEKFALILAMIEKDIEGFEIIKVPYKTRAWTVKSAKV